MNGSWRTTGRRLVRVFYLLGIFCLLVSLLLSLSSQTASASTPARPTQPPPVARTAEGPLPGTPVAPPPANNPDNPGQPGSSLPGQNVDGMNINTGPQGPVSTAPVRLRADYDIGSVRFNRGDLCYGRKTAGWLTATAIVTLPPGVTGILEKDWYVVWPNPYTVPGDEAPNQHHYESVTVRNGSKVSWKAWWPGIDLTWPPQEGNVYAEIHWGASLRVNGVVQENSGSLDYFYNGYCSYDPTLTPSSHTETPTPFTITVVTRTPTITTTPTLTKVTPTPTGIPSLRAPDKSITDNQIIAVTGANLRPDTPVNLWQRILTNTGLLLLGLAFVLQSITSRAR